MTRSTQLDRALSATLSRQDHVVSRSQALAAGLSRDAVLYRVRPGGPWQRLLPGVYLALTGRPTADQKDMAALLYAGPASAITGQAALRGLGISRREPAVIDVLIPAAHRRRAGGFVVIHRTRRMPRLVINEGERRYTMAPRAVADAARYASSLADARAIVASAVQRGRCPPSMLAAELDEGGRRDSARLRIVVGEVADGVRSIAEGEFYELIKQSKLPAPLFNEPVRRPDGTLIAIADAWWPQARLVAEVDSREWHLSPADWAKTMRRHNDLTQHGIHVLHFTPGQIRYDPRSVVATIAAALQQRGTGTAPPAGTAGA
jgi:very-short-patch-repair endonuclease